MLNGHGFTVNIFHPSLSTFLGFYHCNDAGLDLHVFLVCS